MLWQQAWVPSSPPSSPASRCADRHHPSPTSLHVPFSLANGPAIPFPLVIGEYHHVVVPAPPYLSPLGFSTTSSASRALPTDLICCFHPTSLPSPSLGLSQWAWLKLWTISLGLGSKQVTTLPIPTHSDKSSTCLPILVPPSQLHLNVSIPAMPSINPPTMDAPPQTPHPYPHGSPAPWSLLPLFSRSPFPSHAYPGYLSSPFPSSSTPPIHAPPPPSTPLPTTSTYTIVGPLLNRQRWK